MERVLFISHGDKGGVGKSYLSMIAVEYLLQSGPVFLVEADPTQPDLGERYVDVPGVRIGALPLNKAGDAENAIAAFGETLETSDADVVVVNLPAGAGATLDNYSDLLRDLSDSLEYNLIVSYSLEKNRVASDSLVRSLSRGLMSVVDPENRFIVFPEYKGEPETFDWYTRKERKAVQCGEIVMPALGNRSALTKLESTPGLVADLIDKSNRPDGWMIVDQSSLYRWFNAAIRAIEPVFEVVCNGDLSEATN